MLKPEEIIEASSVANFCIERIMVVGNTVCPIRKPRNTEVIALIVDLIVTAAECVRDIRTGEVDDVNCHATAFKIDGNGNIQSFDAAQASDALKKLWGNRQ